MRWVSTQAQHGGFLLCGRQEPLDVDDQQTYVRGRVDFLEAVDHGATHGTF